MSANSATDPARRLRAVGICVLVGGWMLAAWIYVAANSHETDDASSWSSVGGQLFPVEKGDSKRDRGQTERMSGKTGAWIGRLDDSLGSLLHGRNLAYTLAAVCALAAGGCFFLAGLADEEI
jgi:hypothetical protein